MQQYIIKRVLQGLLTLVALSMVVFLLARIGGDPAAMMLGYQGTEEEIQDLRERLGLDRPLPVQYWIFLKDALKGDFGNSLYERRPAVDVVMDRFPASVKLALAAAAWAVPLGLVIGVLCAIKRNKIWDILGRTLAVLGQSLPGFWVGIMLILVFAVRVQIFPISGMGGPLSYVLPAFTIGLWLLAGITRMTRSSMLEVLDADFVTFARAKGTPEASVILKHTLRNATIPVLTFGALTVSHLISGSVVAETVFAWPGAGRLAYTAVLTQDFPVIQTIVMLYGSIFILVNLVTDILYSWIDPRIRYQ